MSNVVSLSGYQTQVVIQVLHQLLALQGHNLMEERERVPLVAIVDKLGILVEAVRIAEKRSESL